MRRIIRTSIELPPEYVRDYSANFWARLTKRPAPKPGAVAVCVKCGTDGILGYELIHRGETRPNNLTCNQCFEAGGKRRAVSNGAPQVAPASKRTGTRRPIARRRS